MTTVAGIRAGDSRSVRKAFAQFWEKVQHLAQRNLPPGHVCGSDKEDVASSVFNTFFRRMKDGQFADVAETKDLWKLLLVLTLRKSANLIRRGRRAKRGRGRLVSLDEMLSKGYMPGKDDVPLPEDQAQLSEELERLLGLLPAGCRFEQVAAMTMEGYSTSEIASKLEISVRTVQLKLQDIRAIWQADVEGRVLDR